MAETVSWDRIAAVLADPDVSSPTKAALLDAYGVAVPDATQAHAAAFARFADVNAFVPAGTTVSTGRNGSAIPDLVTPNLAGLGVATGAGVEVGRWVDTKDLLAQADLESDSQAKLDDWERRVAGGPAGVDSADELLAAGSGGLTFFRLFLPAYNRLVKPPVPPAKLADYKDLYEAESGLEFSVFVDDAQFLLDLSAQLQDSAADVASARDRLQSWGGEAGPAARRHLTKISDRIAELAANLADGEAQTALNGLLRKAVHTLQLAVLQKAQTVAGLRASTVFRAPALTPSDLDCLIDALEPDATDDVLLDAARVMRAEHMPLSSLLSPAVRVAIRGAAQTWTDAFLQWFAAVDRTFRTACGTAATAVEEALRTMAEGYRVQLPEHFFAGIPLLSMGTAPGADPSGGSSGAPTTPGTPGLPAVDPQQLLTGRPPGTGWVDADDLLPPGWYRNPVTGEIGPLFPPGGFQDPGQPPTRPDWLPDAYGYLPADAQLPDGWQVDAGTGELLAPNGFAAGPATVQIGGQTATVQASTAWPGSYEVSTVDPSGVLHSHQISYDAYGHPVVGDDLDGVSQLSDLSTLDDTGATDTADATTPSIADMAAAGMAGGMDDFGGGSGVDVPTPTSTPASTRASTPARQLMPAPRVLPSRGEHHGGAAPGQLVARPAGHEPQLVRCRVRPPCRGRPAHRGRRRHRACRRQRLPADDADDADQR